MTKHFFKYIKLFCTAYSLVDEYESISEKALSTPTSTEQLFQLKEEMDAVEEKVLPELQDKVAELLKKYIFVADYMQISPIVSKLQLQSVQWCNRMPFVLEEHRAIIEKKKLEFQDALKVNFSIDDHYSTYLKSRILFLC